MTSDSKSIFVVVVVFLNSRIMSDFILLLYFFGPFYFTFSILVVRKTMTKSRLHHLLPVASVCSVQAKGVHGSLTKSLGITVRAWEGHREKSVAGANPEQSHYRAVGAGKRCWHGFSSKPNWEKVKWLPSGVAREGTWGGEVACRRAPAQAPPLCAPALPPNCDAGERATPLCDLRMTQPLWQGGHHPSDISK